MSNIVIAKFENTRSVVTDEIWQWNYGQILRIQGLRLPRATEVHFSMGNVSKTRIGTTTDNVTDAVIPDSLIEQSGRLKAYVYLHVGEDDGETEYEITIPVKARAEPEEYDSQEEYTALVQAIELLQDDLETTAADRAAAEAAADAAIDAKDDAIAAKNAAEGYKDDAAAAKRDAESALESVNRKAQDVTDTANAAIRDIGDTKTAAERSINETKTSAVDTVNNKANAAVRDITAAGNSAEGKIGDAVAAAASLEATIGAIGLYIDSDGDICQGEEES